MLGFRYLFTASPCEAYELGANKKHWLLDGREVGDSIRNKIPKIVPTETCIMFERVTKYIYLFIYLLKKRRRKKFHMPATSPLTVG